MGCNLSSPSVQVPPRRRRRARPPRLNLPFDTGYVPSSESESTPTPPKKKMSCEESWVNKKNPMECYFCLSKNACWWRCHAAVVASMPTSLVCRNTCRINRSVQYAKSFTRYQRSVRKMLKLYGNLTIIKIGRVYTEQIIYWFNP